MPLSNFFISIWQRVGDKESSVSWTDKLRGDYRDRECTVGNKTFPMFATSAQMHLYLGKYIF